VIIAADVPSRFPADPAWCTGHYEPSNGEVLHEHEYHRAWGDGDEKVRVGLIRYDTDGAPGQDRVDVQYLADGANLEGSASLDSAAAREFALTIFQAVAATKRPTRSRVGLLLGCVYEFGRALIAAASKP
jgi:hypothetical protein